MMGVTAQVAMQLALFATAASPYQDAYDQAGREGKPLLVLVGADWCPGCRVMKDEMIPKLKRGDGLSRVVFTTVNTDEKPLLARRLLRGNSIPQLVLYTRTRKGWRRAQLTGVHEPQEIQHFLRAEIATQGQLESGETTPVSAGRDERPPASSGTAVQ
jgi:thioredoxin-like negative regulator of GroEL